MKKILTVLLVLALTLTSMSFVFAEETKKFTDVKDNQWFASSIYQLVEKRIVGGFGDGTFRPFEHIQRDQFIKMVIVAMGYNLEQGNPYWAQPHIDKAIELKLIKADEFSTYKVPMTREEMASLIVNAALKTEYAPNGSLDRYIIAEMSDFNDIENKYKQNVIYSYGLGLIAGKGNGTFAPKGILNRAEASVVIMRFLDKNQRKPFVPDVDPNYVLEMLDWEFNPVTIYPPSNYEVIDTAKFLIEAAKKTKGYQDTIYSPLTQDISSGFYENKEERDQLYNDPLNNDNVYLLHLDIGIHTIDYAQTMKYAYSVHVFNRERTAELHRDVLVELFNYLFEDEAAKAIQKLDIYLQYEVFNSVKESFIFNNREMNLSKFAGNDSFQIVITTKLD